MTLFQPRKVVLFDHDGTVVDSEVIALKSAWKLTTEVVHEVPGARDYDLPEFVKVFAGKPYREILAQIYIDSPNALDETDIQRLVEEEEERAIEHLKLEAKATAGTLEVLDYLVEHRIKFALVSNSSLRRVNACLAATGLTSYFPSDRVFSARDSLPIRRSKPLPDVYLHTAKVLQLDLWNCIAIEDSVSGVKSAIAAGIPQVVGYVGGSHIERGERSDRASILQSMGAHQIIEQMPDLIALLSGQHIAQQAPL